MVCIETEARESLQIQESYGHCLTYILPKTLNVTVHWPTYAKLYQQLIAGITLNKGTKLYWFDKKGKGNRYVLLPKSHTIIWIDDCQYWKWIPGEIYGKKIDVAQLIKVCWLDISGKLKQYALSSGVLYEVLCHVCVTPCASGWQEPVIFVITLPDGKKIETKESLQCKPRDVWFTIKIGEFKVDKHDCNSDKEYEFRVYNHSSQWKTGLKFKGFEIRLKQSSCGC
uniref:Phloem lectin n=1 Tax=Cucumis sativus TaxID=3659 RepID=W0ZFB6_CUCSA|nr:phloem lectin [Cucumis sativus]